MMSQINRIIGIFGTVALAVSAFLFFHRAEQQDLQQWGIIPPPARDAIVQSLDLARIASFRYADDHTLEVTDDAGKNFRMELTQACPGLKGATDFSLVTENSRDLDRFTAIAIKGAVCTFKDFSPLVATSATPPAS